MTATTQQPTTCHVCNAQVFVRFVDSQVCPCKVMTAVRPVAPARDCEVCGDVTCSDCSADECPYSEDAELHL